MVQKQGAGQSCLCRRQSHAIGNPGTRRGLEIAGLTWNQIDLSQNTARLEAGETKNREGRTVWLDDEVKAVIQKQWERRKKANKLIGSVFTNKAGDERIKCFREAWRTACKKSGLGYRLFHDLRRTAVRNMVRAGVPERVAMTISGPRPAASSSATIVGSEKPQF